MGQLLTNLLKQLLEDSETDNTTLKYRVCSLRKQLITAKQQMVEYQTEVFDLQRQLQRSSADVATLKKELREERERVINLERQLSTTKQQLVRIQTQLIDLQRQLPARELEVTDLKRQLSNLQQQLEENSTNTTQVEEQLSVVLLREADRKKSSD